MCCRTCRCLGCSTTPSLGTHNPSSPLNMQAIADADVRFLFAAVGRQPGAVHDSYAWSEENLVGDDAYACVHTLATPWPGTFAADDPKPQLCRRARDRGGVHEAAQSVDQDGLVAHGPPRDPLYEDFAKRSPCGPRSKDTDEIKRLGLRRSRSVHWK